LLTIEWVHDYTTLKVETGNNITLTKWYVLQLAYQKGKVKGKMSMRACQVSDLYLKNERSQKASTLVLRLTGLTFTNVLCSVKKG